MMKYHIWTIGCQMNKVESEDISRIMQGRGYLPASSIKDSDLIVVNTCVVRQNAEDKVTGMLNYLKGVKASCPSLKIIVTGCFVDSNTEALGIGFPQVDLFFKPGDYSALVNYLKLNTLASKDTADRATRNGCCVYVPIMQGCNNYCSYCIVPYRRGREKSRNPDVIINQVGNFASGGIKEITLLGQNVNSYGHDLHPLSDLSALLHCLHGVTGLSRIRFLTNHPKDMSTGLLRSISSLDKVCKQVNLPVQSGNNQVLERMNRGYTREDYLELVSCMKSQIPAISLSTDVIVGFPGETEADFNDTMSILEMVCFDVVHCAMYSTRPGTLAAIKYTDDIPENTKKRRWQEVENLQTRIAMEINSDLVGKLLPVLVEGRKGGRWFGRTDSNKLVFFQSSGDHLGQIINARVTGATAWSMQGLLED